MTDLKKKIENWKKKKLEEWKKTNQKNNIKLGDNLDQEIDYEDEETKNESSIYNITKDF